MSDFVPPNPRIMARRAVDQLDAGTDALAERLRGNAAADRLFYAASTAGDWSRVWHVIALLLALRHGRSRKAALRLTVCLGAESLLVNQGVKRLFRRGRPAAPTDHPHGLRTPQTSSFPSGHASSAVLAATLLSSTHRRARPLWWALAAVVAWSRVHVKVHHGSDVVAGALLGRALGRVARRLWPV